MIPVVTQFPIGEQLARSHKIGKLVHWRLRISLWSFTAIEITPEDAAVDKRVSNRVCYGKGYLTGNRQDAIK
jgi:hypothetical protein